MRWPEDRALEAFDAQAATALNRLAAAAAVLVAGVLALLLLTAPAAATTYYVTTSGGGTHSGADSTTNPMTVAEANAAAVAGDVIQFKSGATTGTINPARSGTNASRITYRGFPAWPGACVITGGVTLDSTSATDSGRYISVSGLTFTTGFSGGDTGFYTARWDSLTKCIFGNGGSVCGGYNFLTDCTFGDGTVGDAFSWTYAGGTGSDYYKSFAAKGNKALRCTFNLQITGSTNPAIQIRCQDSLLIDQCRFHPRIDPSGASLHLWTIYGMENSIIRDSYFDGLTLTAQDSHFPSTRDVYFNNTFVRDTILELAGGAAPLNCALMTSGDVTIPGEYNGHNTYTGMLVRVRGYIGYPSTPCNNDVHQFCTYISNGQGGGSTFALDSVTIYHCTMINLGVAVMGNSGGTTTHAIVKGNIFYGGAHITCNGQIGFGTTSMGVSDTNIVYVNGFAADSAESFDTGGCTSYRPGSGSTWCGTYGHDCASHWADPNFSGSSSWDTIDPQPAPTSLAFSGNLWPDGYVGALGAASGSSVTITTTTLPGGTKSIAYSQTVAGTGGTAPYVWSISAGALPTGLSINASTGEISGTPSVAGIFSFTVLLTDNVSATDTQVLSITIDAGNAISSVSIQAEAGEYSIGVKEFIAGDADSDAVARLFYREYGAGVAYDSGMVMARRKGGPVHAGRLIELRPATTYQYYVENIDPDGSYTTTPDTLSTHGFPSINATGNVYYVSMTGASGNTGLSVAQAKRTVAQALSALQAAGSAGYGGGIVLVSPGEWHESVAFNFGSGTQNPKGYFITGSDPALRDSTILDGSYEPAANNGFVDASHAISWISVGVDSIYKTYYPAGDSCTNVTLGYGERLHRKTSMTELIQDAAAERSGFWWQNDTLYVQRATGGSPAGLTLHASYLKNMIWLQVKRVRVSNLTIRFAGLADQGYGVRVGAGAGSPASGSSMDSLRIYGMSDECIYGTAGSDSVVVRNCVFDGRGVGGWTYQAAKTRAEEHVCMMNIGGNAWTVYGNTGTNMANGIFMNAGGPSDSLCAANAEILSNTMSDFSDDAVECDVSHAINTLVKDNAVTRANSMVSLAPIYTGPLWVFRNTIRNPRGFSAVGFKIVGNGYALLAHNTISQDGGGGTPTNWLGACAQKYLRNNIISGGGTGYFVHYNPAVTSPDSVGIYTNDFNYNLTDSLSGSTRMASWRTVSYSPASWRANALGWANETNGVFGAAALADTATGNLRPSGTSPAIDAGQRLPGINTMTANVGGPMYNGTAPDIGAFEFVATPAAASAATSLRGLGSGGRSRVRHR